MRSTRRRRPVHYTVFCYHDGAVVACNATRKPSKKKLKQDGDRIDDDLVYREYYHDPKEVYAWDDEMRVRVADLMANRINMRRAIREIAVPQLSAIEEMLREISARLDRIEKSLAASTK